MKINRHHKNNTQRRGKNYDHNLLLITHVCTTSSLFLVMYLQNNVHESCDKESVSCVTCIHLGRILFFIFMQMIVFIIQFQFDFCVCSLSNMDMRSINMRLLLAVFVFINGKLIIYSLSRFWNKYNLLVNAFVLTCIQDCMFLVKVKVRYIQNTIDEYIQT